MKLKTSLAALMVAASLFGCTTSSTHGVNVNLVATRQNAGQIGTVTLTDWDKKTGLSFFISGAPMGVTLPLRLYSFINNGTCQQPGSVAYAMNDTVNTEPNPYAAGPLPEPRLCRCKPCLTASIRWSCERLRPMATSISFAGISRQQNQ